MSLLYTRMKVFHYKDKIDSLPASRPEVLPPLHIRIKPTNACNHKCSYCAYRHEDLQLGEDMSVRDMIPRDKMREILEDIRFGFTVAKEMGRVDVGQTVVVKNRAVVAVEAMEGSDACIARGRDLSPLMST